jgi:predicted MPP superfamily phosphohydrolase
LLGAGAASVYARYLEPGWFHVTRTNVRLPEARPFRLLHLSDLHISDGITAEGLANGIRLGLAEKPDVILHDRRLRLIDNRF